MGLRGSSTALDVVLFVLLVGASVAVLSGVDAGGRGEADRVADETADVLATSTAELSYERATTVESESALGLETERRVRFERTTRGTYAELLANAVTASPTVAGVRLAPANRELPRETRDAVALALPTRDANVQATAVWRPYVGSDAGGELVVGDASPGDADVSVATATVASGFPNVTAAAVDGARSAGYSGVATALARGVVDGLFPPERTRAALYSEGPEFGVAVARYQFAANALAVDLDAQLERRGVHAANEKLAAALADPLRDELSRAFDSPRAAARAVRVNSVRMTVRAWSR